MSPATVVRNRHVVGPSEVERWLRPRHDVVQERTGERRDDGTTTTTTTFGLDTGPVHEWERTVTVAPAPGAPTGTVEIAEEVRYRLAVPVWGVLFRVALNRHLRRPPRDEDAGAPWWAPPVVVDARAATVLSLLCVIGAVAGYLGTLITQTLTYAAEDFGAGKGAQGTLLASVRVGVLLSLVIVSFADRRGRRSVLIASVIIAALYAWSVSRRFGSTGLRPVATSGIVGAMVVAIAIGFALTRIAPELVAAGVAGGAYLLAIALGYVRPVTGRTDHLPRIR